MAFVNSLINCALTKNKPQPEDDNYNFATESNIDVKTIKTEDIFDKNYENAIIRNTPLKLKELTKIDDKLNVTCNICNLVYGYELNLEKHLYSVHRPLSVEIKGKVYCCKCQNWFNEEIDYELHGPCYAFKAKCILCDIDTSEFSLCQLNLHMKQKHGQPGLFECLECKTFFPNCKTIKQHIAEIHNGAKWDTSTVCVCRNFDNKENTNESKYANENNITLRTEYNNCKFEHNTGESSIQLDKCIKTNAAPLKHKNIQFSTNNDVKLHPKENDYPLVVNKSVKATYSRPKKREVQCQPKIADDKPTDCEYPLIVNKSTTVTYSRPKKTDESSLQKNDSSFTAKISDKSKALSETAVQSSLEKTDSALTLAISDKPKALRETGSRRKCVRKIRRMRRNVCLKKVWRRPRERNKAQCVSTNKSTSSNQDRSTNQVRRSIDLPESTDLCLMKDLPRIGQMPSDLVSNIINIISLKNELNNFYKSNSTVNPDLQKYEYPMVPKKKRRLNTDVTTWPCQICDSTFAEHAELKCHCRLIHRPWALEIKSKLYCPDCENWFANEQNYTGHNPCFKLAVRQKCPICYMDNPPIDHFSVHKVIYRSSFYSCTLCDNNSANYRLKELNIHRQKVHKHNGVFECVDCSLTFRNIYELKKHLVKHKSNNIHGTVDESQQSKTKKIKLKYYKCKKCNKLIFEAQNIQRHILSHEGCLCSVCGMSFKNKHALKVHFNGKHAKNVLYTCKVCSRKFPFKKSLTQHVKIHKVNKNFNCEVCKQSFTQQTSLIYHMASHTKENIFTCNICDIKFDLQSKLSSHMQIHTANGTNPHICKVCHKAFAHECNLLVHMRTHIDLTKNEPQEQSNAIIH